MYQIISKIYDHLNKYKDYNGECNFILNKFTKYNKNTIHKALDIGCGTGSHMLNLSKNIEIGFGIDINKEMINEANKKNITNIKFIHIGIEDFKEKNFDLVMLLFQVVNHIHNLSQLINTFKLINNKLNQGGILIFDVFNSLAMLLEKPNNEIRNVDGIIIKINSNFDAINSKLSINYNYINNETNENIEYSLSETIWSPVILKKILEENGFKICEIKRNYTEEDININSYKLTYICKKII